MRLVEDRQDASRSPAVAQTADIGRLPERLPWQTAAPFIIALSLALWIAILVSVARFMGLA
ncbi:MAG: hypothetical protein JWP04_1868 [Belnapia sp.]|jgi:hypothetical protein|nr:hypothetical protein [Belnapia sp.]